MRSLLLLLFLHLLSPRGVGAFCLVESCARSFSARMSSSKVVGGRNVPYCLLLHSYNTCLADTAKPCRGNIKYHGIRVACFQDDADVTVSLQSLVERDERELNCSGLLDNQTESLQGCLFPYLHSPTDSHLYCSLHGDPHLRTFEGSYESCSAEGAWPLVDNPYLAIQVTNKRLHHSNRFATAVSKVTVIVKSVVGCSKEKVYEANGEELGDLPLAFIDGSGSSAKDVVRIKATESGVDLSLSHVATRVILRKHGRWLSVAVHIPEQIVEEATFPDSHQLCLSGCPHSLLLPLGQFLSAPNHFARLWGLPPPSLSLPAALRACRGLVDVYLDSCVFDLLNSGDTALAQASRAAISDLRHAQPNHSLTNRTDLNIYTHLAEGVAVSDALHTLPAVILILLALSV